MVSRMKAFWACLAAFTAYTVALIADPFLGDIDQSLVRLHPKAAHPHLVVWVRDYELVGQRGPTLLVFVPIIAWLAWRRRDRTPIVALVTAEILLNVGVGIVKYGLGRVGPFASGDAHRWFAGGDIYPSGHVSNAVVLYGLVVMMLAPRWHRWGLAVAVFLSVTVGIGTLFLRTHWLSDVVGGWLAGALVLLALPSVLPTAQRWTDRLMRPLTRRFGRPVPPEPAPVPVRTEAGRRAGSAGRRGRRPRLARSGR